MWQRCLLLLPGVSLMPWCVLCICVGLNGGQSFLCLHTGMCTKIFIFSSSVHGIVILHLYLVPSSSRSFYTSTKYEIQWRTASFVFYVNAEFQGMMHIQNCVPWSKYLPQLPRHNFSSTPSFECSIPLQCCRQRLLCSSVKTPTA